MTADPRVRTLALPALLLLAAVPAPAQPVPAHQSEPTTDWPHYAGGQVNLLEGLGQEVSNDLYGVSSPPNS